jgi:GGDEF domain-containing protein
MEAAASGRCCYAVALVAARIRIVNARFGVGAGDRMLQRLSDHFREGLMPQDRLFRWRGPSFLVLMERAAQIVEIRRSIARMANASLEEHIEMDSRSITLPISAAWSVFPMASAGKDIVQRIDQFVDSQASAN